MLTGLIHLIECYELLLVVVVVVVGWLGLRPKGALVRGMVRLVQPFLDFFRRSLPTTLGAVDVSPLVLGFLLEVLRHTLIRVHTGS